MATYIHVIAHSGGETLTDQLDGTAVARVGPSGRVQAAVVSAKAEDTYRLYTDGGIDIIPAGSHANKLAAADLQSIDASDFIYDVRNLPVGAELRLEIIAAAASESMVGVRT